MWNWRRAGFFALDRLIGSPFRRHLDDLARYDADPVAYSPRADDRLRSLLEHATRTIDYYRSFEGATDLFDFPVMSKAQISREKQRFISSARAGRRLPTASTSGSYGTPFVFPLTWDKWLRQRAEVVHYSRWAGFELGEAHVFTGSTGRRKTRLMKFAQNEDWLDPVVLTDERLEQYCAIMVSRRFPTAVLIPSTAVALARHSLESGRSPDDYALRGILVSGEPIDDEARAIVRRAFGCPVLGRYAAEEFGVIAHECPIGMSYHLNLSTYTVEVLALDCDEPVETGALGRVVVTDSLSHALPLIRYDIGDLAIRGPGCDCGLASPVLSNISGKYTETVFTPSGEPLHRMAVGLPLAEIGGIVQYQFAQVDQKSYTLRLVVLPDFSEEPTLMKILRSVLGESAEISIHRVDDIAPLPSGKRSYFINEWQTDPPRD